jgi:hypothetical protein
MFSYNNQIWKKINNEIHSFIDKILLYEVTQIRNHEIVISK